MVDKQMKMENTEIMVCELSICLAPPPPCHLCIVAEFVAEL